MAAAALYRSRGVAGVRAIKGPFFIFTLLCLVGIATSHIDMDELETFKKNLHKAQEQMESLKANYKSEMGTVSDLINEEMSSVDQMTALVRELSKDLPYEFSSTDKHLQSVKGFMEKVKTDTDKKNKEFGEKIENNDQILRTYWKLLELLEEQQAEL